MEIATTQDGDAVILAPEGRLDGATSSGLEAALSSRIESGARTLVIDFSNLGYVSSAGLRVLLMTAKKMKGTGGYFALCGLKPGVFQVIKMAGFDKILTIHDGVAEALAARPSA